MTTAVLDLDRKFDTQNRHVKSSLLLATSLLTAVGFTAVSANPAHATPAGTAAAKATIATAVTDTIEMIQQIDGIALTAFAVALVPMGFMLTLRVLNMVLSRV
ncbi:hypothetical protein [Phormidium nigroviride]